MRTKLLLLCTIALALLAAWWLQQPDGRDTLARLQGKQAADNALAPAAPESVVIEVVQAHTQTIRDEAQAVGTLVSRQSTALRPEASGRVTAVHFKDGERVKQGQLLLQLDDRLERAQLQQADAELQLSRANHQRNGELVDQGFISRAALDESGANLQVAQARRALALTNLERLRVHAPFDAVAGIGNVHLGDYLREGDEVVQLQDMDVLYSDFRLPERLAAALEVGQASRLEVDALPGESFEATVVAIDPLIDAQDRSVALRASLPNEGYRLRPGMFARVSLTLGQRDAAVVVPEQAVLADAAGVAVIRLAPWDEGDAGADPRSLSADTAFRSERVPVELGMRLSGMVEVKRGLAAGDVVMTAGQHRVNRSDQRVQLSWSEAFPSADNAALQPPRQQAEDSQVAPVGAATAVESAIRQPG